MALSGLLSGVVFHDELFFELDRDLVAERKLHESTLHLAEIDRQVFRSGSCRSDCFLDLHVFLGLFTNGNHVASLDEAARREATNTVHSEVTVCNVLTGSENRTGKTHAEDDCVKTSFEQDHQVITCRTFTTVSFLVCLGKLSFGNVVGETKTLLFDQLLLVNGSRLLAGLTMLARCEVAAVESLLSLLRNGNAERACYFTFRSAEGGHVIPL